MRERPMASSAGCGIAWANGCETSFEREARRAAKLRDSDFELRYRRCGMGRRKGRGHGGTGVAGTPQSDGQPIQVEGGGVMQEAESVQLGARIKVIGVGGGGGNAINTMIT